VLRLRRSAADQPRPRNRAKPGGNPTLFDTALARYYGTEAREDNIMETSLLQMDLEFLKAVESTLGEWRSDNDEEAYRDL
jgi:hypothetical protein